MDDSGKSETKFRTLAEESPNMIFINRRGKVVFANNRCEEIMGYRREEFYAPEFDFMELIAPEYRDLIRENLGKHLRGEEVLPYEYALVDRAGRRIETIITTKLVDFEGEQSILGIVTDITEQKRAEDRLRAAELKYRSLIETTDTGFVIIDETGRVLDANRKYAELCGRGDREEVIGHSVLEWTAPHDLARNAREVAKCMELGSVRNLEIDYITPEGRLTPIEINATVLRDGNAASILTLCRDIRERKRAEHEREELQQQLNQAQKMEVIGRLAGGVAHDFNNMLGVILGYAEMLRERCSADPDRKAIATIEAAATRSRDLVRQLLAFSRKQLISPKPLDLNTAITESHKLLSRVMGEDINLVLQLGASLGTVLLDPSQFDQVLLNLAANARDAMVSGGEIVLTTDNIRLDETYCRSIPDLTPGPYVMFSVRDNGSGMDQETLAHIFEPFYTTKGLGRGTGMGLATVYGIVKQNHGHIEVLSRQGHGTAFKLYFPRMAETQEIASESKAVLPAPTGTGVILLVEDDEMVRAVLVSMISELGYRVFPTAEAGEALAIVERGKAPFDLLITDIILPGMDGKELSRQLLALQPRLKTLFISGYSGDVLVNKGIWEEDAHLLTKPFGKNEVATKIKEVMGDSHG